MRASNPTVLVVEDDQLILLNARMLLENAGYRVLDAADATTALSLLATATELVAMLTDIAMPGPIDGLALAHRVHALQPELPIFLISGSVRPPSHMVPPSTRFLAKPYRATDLVTLLEPAPARCAS